MPLDQFYEELILRTGYGTMLESKNTVEDRTRLENVRELLTSINGYLENAGEEPSLAGFLDEIALYTDLDSHDPEQDCVVMMTMHAAKGLEFPVVFLVGAEEGIFPGMRAIGEQEEMEEERRLCYVAMTRAKEKLYLTCANQRMLFGRTSANRPSRFTEEIPEKLLERAGKTYLSGVGGAEADGDDWGAMPSRSSGYTGYQRPTHSAYGGGRAGQTQGAPAYGGFTRAMSGESRPRKQPAAAGGGQVPSFQKGDAVQHTAFGRGMILAVQKMGGDALVEIAFDNVGTKRLMLKAAAAHMKKL
jgi:DNA helicase-2/ATP-dependent DNA helicase PcrA